MAVCIDSQLPDMRLRLADRCSLFIQIRAGISAIECYTKYGLKELNANRVFRPADEFIFPQLLILLKLQSLSLHIFERNGQPHT